MRQNVSGNVPATCRMNGVAEIPDPDCCPLYLNGVEGTYISGTSAYPHAMSCLRYVGCESTFFYSQTVSECMTSCGSLFPGSDLNYRCTAIKNSANTYLKSKYILISFIAVVFLCLHM